MTTTSELGTAHPLKDVAGVIRDVSNPEGLSKVLQGSDLLIERVMIMKGLVSTIADQCGMINTKGVVTVLDPPATKVKVNRADLEGINDVLIAVAALIERFDYQEETSRHHLFDQRQGLLQVAAQVVEQTDWDVDAIRDTFHDDVIAGALGRGDLPAIYRRASEMFPDADLGMKIAV